ncbi:MAG TPA: hypothetical protein VGD01_14255 [Candidatus Elarobacter sp.]|jgi:hypothetical protein
MDTLRNLPSTKRSPLEQAKTHERIATYSIALIDGEEPWTGTSWQDYYTRTNR